MRRPSSSSVAGGLPPLGRFFTKLYYSLFPFFFFSYSTCPFLVSFYLLIDMSKYLGLPLLGRFQFPRHLVCDKLFLLCPISSACLGFPFLILFISQIGELGLPCLVTEKRITIGGMTVMSQRM